MNKSDVAAIVSSTVILGLTGIALFIWVAAQGWKDSAGLVVSIIFVMLTAAQAVLTVVWWRLKRSHNAKFEVGTGNGDYHMNDSKHAEKGALVIDVKGGDEASARHRGNGDVATTEA